VLPADGEDPGCTLVELGMAWAFVRYSRDYFDAETQARPCRAARSCSSRPYKDCRTSIDVSRYSLAPRLVPLRVSNIVSGS
jgi:hypothetical protein